MRWECLLTGLALLLLFVPAVAAAATWGYDLPYSYAYGAGVPFYVGHNNGAPSGEIFENPALSLGGGSDPSIIYGQPENAMDLNFSHAFPFINSMTYGGPSSPFTFHNII
jgi:hypothetical protein